MMSVRIWLHRAHNMHVGELRSDHIFFHLADCYHRYIILFFKFCKMGMTYFERFWTFVAEKRGCCKIAPTKNEIGFPKRGLFTWRFIRGIDDFNEAVLWYFKWFGLHLKKLFTELCPSRNGNACWTNWKLCQNQLGADTDPILLKARFSEMLSMAKKLAQ